VTGRNKHAALAGRSDQRARRANFGRNHREAVRERIERGFREAFGERGLHEHIRLAHALREHLPIELTEKRHAIAEAAADDIRFQHRALRTITSDQQMRPRAFFKQREGAQQDGHAFFG
jgi:hypothetical protein